MNTIWEKVAAGDKLQEYVNTPDLTQLVKFAAGSGDFNPLHYNYEFPQSKKIGSIIVHGRYKYALLGRYISNWLSHQGRIRTISCQYRGMDLPGGKLICKGVVNKKWEENGEKLISLEVWIENEKGANTTPGNAVVILF